MRVLPEKLAALTKNSDLRTDKMTIQFIVQTETLESKRSAISTCSQQAYAKTAPGKPVVWSHY